MIHVEHHRINTKREKQSRTTRNKEEPRIKPQYDEEPRKTPQDKKEPRETRSNTAGTTYVNEETPNSTSYTLLLRYLITIVMRVNEATSFIATLLTWYHSHMYCSNLLIYEHFRRGLFSQSGMRSPSVGQEKGFFRRRRNPEKHRRTTRNAIPYLLSSPRFLHFFTQTCNRRRQP